MPSGDTTHRTAAIALEAWIDDGTGDEEGWVYEDS